MEEIVTYEDYRNALMRLRRLDESDTRHAPLLAAVRGWEAWRFIQCS